MTFSAITPSVWLLLAYFAVLLIIAHMFSRRVDTLKDFFLAGRNLGSWPVALSFAAAWFGAGSTMGSINAFHDHGLSGAWQILIPSALSFLFITLLMAKPVSRQTHLSQPEAVEAHYGRSGRILLALIILACTITTLGSQMVAAGQVFKNVFGLDITWATVFSTAVVVGYAMWGGFFTVVLTDIIQIFFVAGGFLILLLFTANTTLTAPGGWHSFLTQQAPGFWNPAQNLPRNICMAVTFAVAWGIAPEMWQRMSSTRSESTAFRAGWQTLCIVLFLFSMIVSIGLLSTRIIGHSPAVMVDLATRIPNKFLGTLVLLGFIAAVTSTMDTLMNVGSLTLTRDIYQAFLHPKASNRRLIWVGRVATCLISIPAVMIALYFQDIIKILWISADIYVSCMFFPVMGMLYLASPGRWSGILAMAFGGAGVAFSALVQNHLITLPFAWPGWPYSTLISIFLSGAGFGLGYWLSHRPAQPEVPAEEPMPEPALLTGIQAWSQD